MLEKVAGKVKILQCWMSPFSSFRERGEEGVSR